MKQQTPTLSAEINTRIIMKICLYSQYTDITANTQAHFSFQLGNIENAIYETSKQRLPLRRRCLLSQYVPYDKLKIISLKIDQP